MTFLAGPPNYGRGAVLQRHIPRTPEAPSVAVLSETAFPDLNPYSYVPLSQASGSGPKPATASLRHQNGVNGSTEPKVTFRATQLTHFIYSSLLTQRRADSVAGPSCKVKKRLQLSDESASEASLTKSGLMAACLVLLS